MIAGEVSASGIHLACGRHVDDHVCLTSKDGIATKADLRATGDEVEKLKRTVSDLETRIAELDKAARHRVVDVEPIRYECSCGSSFPTFAAFKAHQREGR